MAKITRKNPKAFAEIVNRLKELDGTSAKAGWFATSKYEDGTPVAYVAAIQEYGAHINHPGGTPYKVVDGRAVFVRKDAPGADSLPKTKPHPIVIPPRPFMRPTVDREQKNWAKLLAAGARAVLRGNASAALVMEAIGLRAAADIAKSITLVTSPPLKPATIRARMNVKVDKRTLGLLGKPLIDSGKMYEEIVNSAVNHRVEKA